MKLEEKAKTYEPLWVVMDDRDSLLMRNRISAKIYLGLSPSICKALVFWMWAAMEKNELEWEEWFDSSSRC